MSENILKRGLKNLFDLVGYQIVNKNQFGNNILADLKTILGSENKLTLFDIGANLGQTTLEFAGAFSTSSIYAFEPDPETYSKLTEQTKMLANVNAYNLGFGRQQEELQMNINKNSGGNSILSVSNTIKEFSSGDWTETVGQRKVEITTLNSFCKTHKIDSIDLLKMDTQGYEMKIIEGGDKIVLSTFTKAIFIEVLFVELYIEQAYFTDIYKILTERGFRLIGFYNKFHKVEPPHFLLWCDALFVSETL